MNLIYQQNSQAQEYEEVLLKRDACRKQAKQYEVYYIHTFGELLTEAFLGKIAVIRKKKIITYCQSQLNHGRKIHQQELDQYINHYMEKYEKQLQAMIQDRDACRELKTISEADTLKIKVIYRRVAKRIHPDLNPSLANDETIKELWNRVCIAYQRSVLKDMEELEVLINRYLKEIGQKDETIILPDLDEKIQQVEEEIIEILNTEPYQYRFLLEDKENIKEKKRMLKEDIQVYQAYQQQLDQIIQKFPIKKVLS